MQLGDHSHLRRWTKTVSGAYVWNTLSLSLSLPSLLPYFLPSFLFSFPLFFCLVFLSFIFPSFSLLLSLSLSRCLNVKWVDGWIVEFTVTWLIFKPHWNFHVLEKIHPTQLGYHWCVFQLPRRWFDVSQAFAYRCGEENCCCFAVQMGGFIQHFQPPKKGDCPRLATFFLKMKSAIIGKLTGSHCPDRCLRQAGRFGQCWEVDEANGWRPGMDWNTSSEKRTVEVRLSPRVLLIVELTGIWSMGMCAYTVVYSIQ